MQPSHFQWSVDGGLGRVVLNRPERKNPLTFESYAELRDLFRSLTADRAVKTVMISGAGDNFCSGGDVHEIIGRLLQMDPGGLLEFTRMTGSVVQRMRECPVPIIAAVNGVAAGAGAVIALAADFRLLARSASFAFLFTKVGLAGADMGSAYLLPRLVGLGRATELLVLGDTIDAERAREIGLGSEVVPDEELPGKAVELARRLADGPTLAYATTKMLLSRELDMDLAGSIELEAMTQALLMRSEDHAEFYRAFTEGRDPKWTGH